MVERWRRRSAGGRLLVLALALGSAAWLSACASTRDVESVVPVFDRDVAPILTAKCASCHSGATPEGGYSVASYLTTIACNADGAAVVIAADPTAPVTAPLVAVLDTADHASLLTPTERAIISNWIAAGAPARHARMHPVGMIDPRSPDWHGKLLRDGHFARMLDGTLADACSNCHAGTPSARNPALPALTDPPGLVTPCTNCHTAPGGVLACGTCHGDGASRAIPPRDACFFPSGPVAGAHTAHLAPRLRATALECTTCHAPVDGTSAETLFSGTHVNGTVDLMLDRAVAGPSASYDAGTCSMVACHSHGGVRATPTWTTMGPLGCQDCHASPPPMHYPYVCTNCHPGVNDAGDALTSAILHVDGQVEYRDGTRRCGACHGNGDDPWPTTGAHRAHSNPTLTAPLACANCHVVPTDVLSPGHLDDTVGPEIVFPDGGLARARGAMPVYDPATKTCANVACHGAGTGFSAPAGYTPTWRLAGPGEAPCGSCHLAPPPPPHTLDRGCQASICHGSEISIWPDGPRISDAGRVLHIDGTIRVGAP